MQITFKAVVAAIVLVLAAPLFTLPLVSAVTLSVAPSVAQAEAETDPFEDGRAAYGRGDYAAAARKWRPLAEAGDAEVQYYLGTMYGHGRGVEQDDAEAARWYQKAADQGHATAQLHLGVLYENGLGTAQDDGAAAQWFLRAGGRGYKMAQHKLGALYAEGIGVKQDYVRAHMWWSLSARQGNWDATEARDDVERMMTDTMIEEAEDLARQWRPK